MGYELVKIGFAKNERVFSALNRLGFSMKKAQNLCDKGRILDSSARTLAKNELFSGELFMIDYICYPKGLKPVFETDDFAVFEKPSGICSHPNGRNSPYNMYDEIWHLYGREACVAHRLDAETSGLLLVAKSKNSAKELKALFEERKVLKSYLALVRGDLRSAGLRQFCAENFDEFFGKLEFLSDFNGFVIDKSMSLGPLAGHTKQKMEINPKGKRAVTLLRILEFLENSTLVECYPLTGRQHQIRLHLHSVGHAILGDPLYNLEKSDIERILDNKMSEPERVAKTGAKRLMLHAKGLVFDFRGQHYEIFSAKEF